MREFCTLVKRRQENVLTFGERDCEALEFGLTQRCDVDEPLVIAVDGDVLYIATSNGKLRAVDAENGSVRWSWDSGVTSSLNTPSATETGIFTSSVSGSLYLIDRTGTLLWEYKPEHLTAGFSASIVHSEHQMIALSNARELLSFSLDRVMKSRRHRTFNDISDGSFFFEATIEDK